MQKGSFHIMFNCWNLLPEVDLRLRRLSLSGSYHDYVLSEFLSSMPLQTSCKGGMEENVFPHWKVLHWQLG